ncbi:MAG: dTMP kinase [bacterium]
MFFVIEGPDGTGKTKQSEQLVARLEREGRSVFSISFPRYETPTGMRVREYLNGKFGTIEEVGAKEGSRFYADDRKAAADEIRAALEAGKVVVANRYVASNSAHQGSKIHDAAERRAFFAWNDDLEYRENSIPVPTAYFILSLPYEVAMKRVDIRGNAKDMHELDPDHLRRAHDVYMELAELFPERFRVVDCMNGAEELTIEQVHERVWTQVLAHLR